MYYIALLIIAILFISRIIIGFRKGMVQEIASLLAMVLAGICLFLIVGAIGNYMDQEMGKLVQSIVILVIVCVLYRLLHTLFTSLELISKLPIIKWLDKLLGAVMGAIEAALIVALVVYFLKQWGLSLLV